MSRHAIRTPDTFALDIGAAIDEVHRSSGRRKAVVTRKLRTVLDESGRWSRRGSSNVTLIIEALERHGIHTDWDLRDDRLELDSYVWFARKPIRRRDVGPVPFRAEADLIRFIADNYEDLFRGVPELDDLDLVGSEVEYQSTPSEARPDLELEDAKRRRVVVEVELGDPKDNSAMQLRKYMSEANAVLGVLVTARPSSADVEALFREALEDMEPRRKTVWLMYDFTIKRVG